MSVARRNDPHGEVAARKLETARTVVNLCAFAAASLAGGCGGPNRPAPVAPWDAPWPAPAGGAAHSPYAGEPVPDGDAEEAWSRDAGRGLVAPLLAGGRLLIATTTGGEVIAFSTADGSRYWTYEADGAIARAAVPHGELLFVATEGAAGRIHAVSLRDGRERWARTVDGAPFPPLVVGDSVFVVTDGAEAWALDAGTGEPIWTRSLPEPAASTPIAYRGALYLPTTADTLYRLTRATGEITGRAPLPGTAAATPTCVGRTLIIPLDTGELLALDLPSMMEQWRTELGAPALAPPAPAADGRVFVLTTAAELWRVDDPATGGAQRIADPGGAARGALTVARGRILVGRLDGTLLLLRPDGSVVWEKKFDDSIAAPAAVRDGAIYVPLLRGRILKLR